MNVICVLLLILVVLPTTVSLTVYNTSMVCLRGSDSSNYVTINCYSKDSQSLVVVHRIIQGLTPSTSGCSITAPRNTCCPDPYNPARECVFSTEEDLEQLRDKCDGYLSCGQSLDRATVGEACPTTDDGLTYDNFAEFAFVEYSCADTNLMSDVCDTNTTMTGEELFVETNFFHRNQHHANKTCSCVITTTCQNSLIFEVVDLDLACTESLLLRVGGAGDLMASFNCSTDRLAHQYRTGGEGGVFHSPSSVAGLDLQLDGNNTGTFLIRVTATGGAPVQVLCGQPSSEGLFNEDQCSSTTSRPSPGTEDLSSPTFNTTKEACLRGSGSINDDFDISCSNIGVQGLIYVERIFHGLTPDSMDCSISAPKAKCCPGYDAARDCVFSTDEGLEKLRSSCDGSRTCYPNLERATVDDACPSKEYENANVTYGRYSYFAFVEFSCVNTGLMSDVCSAGNTVRNTEVYLETNVIHRNHDHFNETCSCVVSTECGHHLLFHPLDFQLVSGSNNTCLEEVVITDDGNSSASAKLDCNSNDVDEVHRNEGGAAVFKSQTNVVNFHLLLGTQHEGKMLLRVTASERAILEVRCGRTTELDVWDQHQCPTSVLPSSTTSSTTSTTITVTPAASTTQSVSQNTTSKGSTDGVTTKPDAEEQLDTGIAVAVGIVAFLIVVVIVILIIIIWRSRKQPENENGDTADVIVTYNPRAVPDDEVGTVRSTVPYDNPYDVLADVPEREKQEYEPLPNGGSMHYEHFVQNMDEDFPEKHPYDNLDGRGKEGCGNTPQYQLDGDDADQNGAVGGMGIVNPTYERDGYGDTDWDPDDKKPF